MAPAYNLFCAFSLRIRILYTSRSFGIVSRAFEAITSEPLRNIGSLSAKHATFQISIIFIPM